MDDDTLLKHLEEIACTISIEVRYERMGKNIPLGGGGLCRLRDSHVIIIDKTASSRQKVMILAQGLKRFNLSDVYIIPAVRDILEKGV